MLGKDIVAEIRSALKLQSVDVSLTDRSIFFRARRTTSKYVKQALDKRKLWDSTSIFTTLKIELEPHPLANYCEYQSDCLIARSKNKLPKLQEGLFGISSQGIFNLNRTDRNVFKEMSPQRYSNLLKLGLSSKNIYYWIFDDYLCISKSTIESVLFSVYIDGDIPEEFKTECGDTTCPDNPLDGDFKAPAYMVEDIVNNVVQFYQQTFKRSVADNTSDNLDQAK